MPLFKYAPFATENDDLPTGLRLFQDSVARILSDQGVRPWTPAVDIVEGEHELLLKADVPGISLNDIDIRMENGVLTLKGERKFEGQQNGSGYHRIERSYGSFARSFTIPDSVDPEQVKAEYKDGVLTVRMAKKEIAKPRSIKVEVSQ